MWLLFQKTIRTKTQEIHQLEKDSMDKQVTIAGLEVRLSEGHRHMEEKLALLNAARDQIKNEFSVLASNILEEKGKSFSTQNRENMEAVLSPLREQIGEFKKRIEDIHLQQETGRAALNSHIDNLQRVNLQISQEANNLADALKGNNKTQGNWGELVLERVLEMSGLERGREYETQFETHDDNGDRFIPDVIVRLPQSKDVVLDSKVSLTAWELYCSADTEEQRAEALKNHIQSIRRHIQNLSEKRYDQLPEIHSLDHVLLFVPIEAAYITAIKQDNGLFAEAFKQKIVLVCPSTLLVTLKVISFTWRLHHQTENVFEISRKAGSMVDKLYGFVETLQEIGEAIHKSSERYDSAIKVLSTGKGNLIKRAEELQALGVKGKKDIPKGLLPEDPDGQAAVIEGEAL
jgi:DNA recombination protein RmuC